jgi:phosphate transport system permease protein
VAAAIFLSEGFVGLAAFGLLRRIGLHLHPFWGRLPDEIERLLKNLIELLAAIPSVVYGLWGLFVVIPVVRPLCNWLHLKLGWIPFFASDLSGPGVLPAVIVLSIMIMPTITAISRDALTSVPPMLRMAAYGLGATRWEAILAVILPTALRGIFGGIVLALGRALGETMALAMLVGNSNQLTLSLFAPANTLAALLANSFPEAGARQIGVLMYAALVLLGITLTVNVIGALIIQARRSCASNSTGSPHEPRRRQPGLSRHPESLRRRRLLRARALAASAAHAARFSDECDCHVHDTRGVGPTVLGRADAALAWRPETQPRRVHTTSPRAARTGRRLR